MSYAEKLLEGKYNYLKDGAVYSEEEFHVEKEDKSQGNYTFHSEILSRLRTGEFLKIYVDYELTHQFIPLRVCIKRRLGDKSSTETYTWDIKSKNLSYEFEDTNGKRHFHEQVINSKTAISTPAFLTSMIMVNHRKMDPVHKTPYQVISSSNLWDYEGPFYENEMFLELQSLDQVEIELAGNKLNATHCKMFHVASKDTNLVQGDDIYLSKHFYIPYKANFQNNVSIEIESLKTFEDQFSKR